MTSARLISAVIAIAICLLALVFLVWPNDDSGKLESEKINSSHLQLPMTSSQPLISEKETQKGPETDPLEQSRDLRALFEANKNAKDPEHALLAYRAWHTCMPNLFGARAALWQQNMSRLADDNPQKIAYQRMRERCQHFADVDNDTLKRQQQELAGRWLHGDAKTTGESASRLMQTGDYQTAMEIARVAFNSHKPQDLASLSGFAYTYLKDQIGNDEDEMQAQSYRARAFTIAACQTGMACSQDSLRATEHCMYSGQCEGSLIDHYMQSLASDRERQQLMAQSKKIIAAMQSNADLESLLAP
ncbi:hypothetical protein ACO0KY_02335 [Undibacterium sp. Dicai25W]|uniref:hypothetical protein n=1 Tax=Undibacterium sp. Dicai25W TaxID=3413034 RepID=UPI003BF298D3